MNNKIIFISVVIVFSLPVTSSLFAHDSNRIDELERRLSILESMVLEKQQNEEIIGTSEGWKSLANWRKLKTGMDEIDVRKILGEPQRIDSGQIVFWNYENEGFVTFLDSKVVKWEEPR